MTVDRTWLLWLAPVLAVVVGVLALVARRRRVTAASAWSSELGEQASRIGRRSPFILAVVALLIGIGMAGPRWGRVTQDTESRALNIALVVDVSKSMLAGDAAPDRLTSAVRVARRLVQDLSGDRMALVVFAARPYLLSPLTLDESAISLQLDALDPSVASEGGSGMAGSLTLARQVLLRASEGGDRVVVVLTDGESFDGEQALNSAASALKGEGITLVAVPFGTTEGARIPDGRGGWHRDESGVEVVTRRNDELLQAMVSASDGMLIPVDALDPAGEVRRSLERLDRAKVRDQVAADMVPRGWVFALGALLLLGLQALTRRTAALICLLLAVNLGSAVGQRPSRGFPALQRGDTAAATESFLLEAQRTGGDTAWFNAGTAALVAGDLESARAALERATSSLDPELRRRALYNLGTAQLHQARTDSTIADSMFSSAARNLQAALRLDPGDAAAKYNYELAQLLRPPPPPPQGGGGGEDEEPQPSSSQQEQGEPRSGMSQAEAEQVLDAMERAERETRRDLARRQRRSPVRQGPDW